MEDKKLTKKEMYAAIAEFVTTGGSEAATAAEIVEFCNNQVDQLEHRADKAKETAAKKKAEDPLLQKVADVMTDDYQTVADIILALDEEEDITAAKVVSRLSKLEKDGKLEKAQVLVPTEDGKTRKVVAYRVAGVED